jgi:subtilase family serine protease
MRRELRGVLKRSSRSTQISSRFKDVIHAVSGLSPIFLGTGSVIRASGSPGATPTPSNNGPSAVSPAYKYNNTEAFGPIDERTFYDATTLINSGTTGASIDCIALTDASTFSTASAEHFNSQFGLPLLGSNLTTVLVGSGPTQNAAQLEALIDIEWAHSLPRSRGKDSRLCVGDEPHSNPERNTTSGDG